MSGLQYARQLRKRWGLKAPRQFLSMLKLHRTPFDIILRNIFEVMDKHDSHFAFPTIAAIARMKPEFVKMIEKEGHEVASHGYNHLRYPTLSPRKREQDLALSLQTFKKLGVNVKGFRAPYDNYTDDMPKLIETYQLLWDGGYGYRPEHRERTDLFHVEINGSKSQVIFIPLNVWSDDRMIDTLQMTSGAISKRLIHEVSQVADKGGVIMFDLHPIRMGQEKYVKCLDEVLEHANSIGGWCPNPRDAVEYWKLHKKWKNDARFCLLLTGDIDNWSFSDYLRRQLWKRML